MKCICNIKDLETKLRQEIYSYYSFGKEPKFIVMNPDTLKELIFKINIPDDLKSYKYMGYDVYRSEDVELNEFKIG